METKQKKNPDRIQTTARIPRSLSRIVRKLCIDLDVDQIQAINEALEFWVSYQHGDKYLKRQMDEAVRNWRNRIKVEDVVDEEETTTKNRRRVAG